MEHFLDKKYDAIETLILGEIDPQIEIEDHSFSYSYGSENGIRKQIDVTVEEEELVYERNISKRCIEWILSGIQDNIELFRNVNGYELQGSLKFKVEKMVYKIFIEWRIVGYDFY